MAEKDWRAGYARIKAIIPVSERSRSAQQQQKQESGQGRASK